MVVTNDGKELIGYLIGSTATKPAAFAIGVGSLALTASSSTLGSEVNRQAYTSTDVSTAQKITWQADWNSVDMSGIQLSEVGIFNSTTANTGSAWSLNGSFAAITFDGSNELQIQETWEVY